MVNIYQVILGDIPEYLTPCIESVEKFSKRNDYNYNIITEIPSWSKDIKLEADVKYLKYLLYRTVSEWIRYDLLRTIENVLVVDWDIYLHDDFVIDTSDVCFTSIPIECMIFNGTKTNIFERMHSLVGDRINTKPGNLDLVRGINKYIENNKDFKFNRFDRTKYMHLDNCRLARDYYNQAIK